MASTNEEDSAESNLGGVPRVRSSPASAGRSLRSCGPFEHEGYHYLYLFLTLFLLFFNMLFHYNVYEQKEEDGDQEEELDGHYADDGD
jgi:hypothetical protein